MFKMKKGLVMVIKVLVVVLTIGLFTGCSQDTQESESTDVSGEAVANDPTEIEVTDKTFTLGLCAYPAYYPWYITEAEGLFEANGIDVEIVFFPVFSDSAQAFNSGQLDMLCTAMPDIIAPYISGIEFKTVMVLDNSSGADGLVGKEGINSLEDLEGKTIATEYGTIEHFFLLQALQTVELTEEDFEFVNLSISDSAPALISGSVDAASLWEPALSTALELEGSTLLFSSEDTPGLIADGLIVSGDMIDNYPDEILSVLNAYYDTMDFYVANEEAAITYMAEEAEMSYDDMKVAMSGSTLFTIQESIDAMDVVAEDYSYMPYTADVSAEFLLNIGMIDSVPDDSTKMFDSSYLKAILETRESIPVPDTKK